MTGMCWNAEYICNGPLQESCNISPEFVRLHFPRWLQLGDVLIGNLGFPPKEELSPAQRYGEITNQCYRIGVACEQTVDRLANCPYGHANVI